MADHLDQIDELYTNSGALLFRGFPVVSASDFNAALGALGRERLDYTYRSTPRHDLGRGVYTASEYPKHQAIPLHNENAFQRKWPMHLAFCCLEPADSGGCTPLANMTRVTESISTALLSKLETLGVRYVRHYGKGMDLPWQDVFQTADRAELSKICTLKQIDHTWISPEIFRTSQTCQGVAYHPDTGERVFFNQSHLFHPSSLGPELHNMLRNVFGNDMLPRNALFGDGSEFTEKELELIRSAYNQNISYFRWAAGDVLLIDNMKYAHGREPYTGNRSVLAMLMGPHEPLTRDYL